MWQEDQAAWNARSSFFVKLHDREDRVQQVEDFLTFTHNEGLLPAPGGSVLDIGCATADYALRLAREGYRATGIDLSDGMINGAREIAEKEKLDIELYVGPWSEETRQQLGWNRQFDFTYTSFCPVMFQEESIIALDRTSRKHCLWIAFKHRTDKIVDMLHNDFFGTDAAMWTKDFDGALSIIERIGDNVKIHFEDVATTEVLDLDEAVDYFSMRIHGTGKSQECVLARIRELLTPLAVDGKVTNESLDTIARVSWQVRS